MKNKTIAQEALELLSPIPEEQWITNEFTDYQGRCCAIGHYQRLKSGNPDNYNYENCIDNWEEGGFRDVTRQFLDKKYGVTANIADVNNKPNINGYTQPSIKERVITCLKEMVEEGY